MATSTAVTGTSLEVLRDLVIEVRHEIDARNAVRMMIADVDEWRILFLQEKRWGGGLVAAIEKFAVEMSVIKRKLTPTV